MSKPKETIPAARSGSFQTARRTPTGIEPQYDFASDEAAELWHASGRPELGQPSGKGGHTVADVRAALDQED